MSLENCVQINSSTIQFDLFILSDDAPSSDLRYNSTQWGINFNTGCLQPGDSLTPSYISNSSEFIPPGNAFTFPVSTIPDHLRIIQSPLTGGNTNITMQVNRPYRVGTFQVASSSSFVKGCCPAFSLQAVPGIGKTITAALVWIGTATYTTSFSTTGTGHGQRSIFVDCALCLIGIDEYDGDASIGVFPNPNNGSFTVSLSDAMRNATLKIFNVLGEEVYSEVISNEQRTINYKLSWGIYFAEVNDGVRRFVRKIVVE